MAKAEQIVEKVEEVVEKVADAVAGRVEVALVSAEEAVLKGVHTVFHAKGHTEFVDGVAKVTDEVAAHLKESGLVK